MAKCWVLVLWWGLLLVHTPTWGASASKQRNPQPYTGKKPSLRLDDPPSGSTTSTADLPVYGLVEPAAVPVEDAIPPSNPATSAAAPMPVPVGTEAEAGAAASVAVTQGSVLPAGVAPATVPAGCAYSYAQADIRPLRNMWTSSKGYCGELVLQNILLTQGVWIGQRQARSLAGCSADLMFAARSVATCNPYPFLRDKLAFDAPPSSYWDGSNQTLTYATVTSSSAWPYQSNTVGYTNPNATRFLEWVKRQIIAGRPVMVAVRLAAIPFILTPDPKFDHIIPVFGVCSTDVSANAPLINSIDSFSMSTDLKDEFLRRASDPTMFSRWKACSNAFAANKGGCIPSDNYNYGVAVGQIRDPTNILVKTVKLTITSWSNNFDSLSEPGESSTSTGNSVTARYKLSVKGLTSGASYTTFRMSGLLPGTPAAVPTTYANLAARCSTLGASGCTSTTYTAPAGGAVDISEVALGAFPANSLQYFLTARKP